MTSYIQVNLLSKKLTIWHNSKEIFTGRYCESQIISILILWVWLIDGHGPLPKPIFSPIGSKSGITFSPWDPAFPHYSEAWNCLWSLKLQPRLKYMLWKITWNSLLPVRANIGTFIQYGDTDSWTTHHVFLLDCPIARIIWRSSKWPLDTSVFINQPITWWIKAILKPRISAVHPKKGLPWAPDHGTGHNWSYMVCKLGISSFIKQFNQKIPFHWNKLPFL